MMEKNWSTVTEHDVNLTEIAKQRLTICNVNKNSKSNDIENELYNMMLYFSEYYKEYINNKNMCKKVINIHVPLIMDYLKDNNNF
jgi:hypothetical protein